MKNLSPRLKWTSAVPHFLATAGISFVPRSPSLSSIFFEIHFKKHHMKPSNSLPCIFSWPKQFLNTSAEHECGDNINCPQPDCWPPGTFSPIFIYFEVQLCLKGSLPMLVPVHIHEHGLHGFILLACPCALGTSARWCRSEPGPQQISP